jgi:hypothetical protein
MHKVNGKKFEKVAIITIFHLSTEIKSKNIVRWIKGQRVSWLGYLERMEENRMPKLIFSQELEGLR